MTTPLNNEKNPSVLKSLEKLRQGIGNRNHKDGLMVKRPGRRSGLDVPGEKPRVEGCEHEDLKVRWINIERAEQPEINWLRKNFHINPVHLEDITSYLQRPKLDEFDDDNYIFLVLHFPVFNKVEGVSVAEEVDIFLGPDFIITIHDAKLRPLNKLFEQCKNNPGKRMGLLNRNPAYTLYKILDVLVDYIFPILNKIDDNLEGLDEKIFKASSQSTIYEISTVRRDILAIRRILKPQISVLSSLERRKRIVGENDELDLEPLYADITDHINKVWDTLEEYKEIIESLSNTYDSLNSHRLNAVIKTLTIISVMTLPLTVITGLWGMNVGLPLINYEHAFVVIIGIMVFTILGMLAFFKWRKWL